MLSCKSMNNLFLRQSYLDSWQGYQAWLKKGRTWDMIVLTASNESQADVYRKEIDTRLEEGHLPDMCEYIVLADPEGKRVGSGGATLNVLHEIACRYGGGSASVFRGRRILVIHSGGDSKRVPQYSVCGKLFSPVPRLLPDGRPSTLFDEFMISMSEVAGRFEEGMLVLSGDVLLLFNPLQLDFQFKGAAAISMKSDVSVGKDHGVFLNNGQNYVGRFLHKQSEEQLRAMGAVNSSGKVDLDTGAVLLDAELLAALFSLIDGEEQFHHYVNERTQLSFYGDFLYPLASDSSWEEYCRQAPEGTMSRELLDCRKEIWRVLSPFSMKLLCLAPAEFVHFGTTGEFLHLVTEGVKDYRFLEWDNIVHSNARGTEYAVYNSIIDDRAVIGKGSYVENSIVGEGVIVGEGSILSGVAVRNVQIPSHVVLHGLALVGGKYVARIFGVEDNPKDHLKDGSFWLGERAAGVLEYYRISPGQIWGKEETIFWFADFYPVCDTMEEAVEKALMVYRVFRKEASRETADQWLSMKRTSLSGSFHHANMEDARRWSGKITEMICVEQFIGVLNEKGDYRRALRFFSHRIMTGEQFQELVQRADNADFSLKIRIYYALSKYIGENCLDNTFPVDAKTLEEKCFRSVQDMVCGGKSGKRSGCRRIQKEECNIALPVRVNWGGGWTDTPPYCMENGGLVLNAAIKVNGILPVQVCIRRLEDYHVEFASEDIGVQGAFYGIEDILDCKNPYDHFALHKAALIACGIVEEENYYGGKRTEEAEKDASLGKPETLRDILRRLGGGIYLSTKVAGIPKGSGLGTSSILAGGCVKVIYEFLGETITENELYSTVLRMEQIMSTGGGWQDQVGGLCPGIKLIASRPGIEQHLEVEPLKLSPQCLKELQERFVIIYTGQRRLARNLLRDVVGNYIGGRQESVQALEEMKRVTVLMKYELENGNIDRFAKLLDEHWQLSLQLDSGASNTCLDQIFRSCEDLIDARFIAGAGGGGFLQAILKKGVTAGQLNERLYEVFQDSGVAVWNCEFA